MSRCRSRNVEGEPNAECSMKVNIIVIGRRHDRLEVMKADDVYFRVTTGGNFSDS